MGLFTKKTSTHFERDKKGRVTKVTRSGDNTSTFDTLNKQYKQKHPSRWEQYKQKKARERQLYKEEYEKTKNKQIKQRARRVAKQRYSRSPLENLIGGSPQTKNANPFGSLFDTGLSPPRTKPKKTTKTKYVVKNGKAYPIVHRTKKKKTSTKRKGYDPFDNWGLLK